MDSQKNILILTTGGTIEKSYIESEGVVSNRDSLLKEKLIKKLRLPYTHLEVSEVMAKDSLYMTQDDRRVILKKVQENLLPQRPILILHGTDTMVETAQFIYHQILEPPIPIVFTGAMKPAGFDDSDALQNFTEALIVCKLVKPGYYISFHNHIFKIPYVRKNHQLGTFESTK